MKRTSPSSPPTDLAAEVAAPLETPVFGRRNLLFWRNRRFSSLRAMLWITLGLMLAVLLPFFSVGSYQFGARFLYDGYAYAFLLLALGDACMDWRFAALRIIGIVVNDLGALQRWTGIMLQV